jgi:hypothetical protein
VEKEVRTTKSEIGVKPQVVVKSDITEAITK